MSTSFTRDPDSVLDYLWDWTQFLGDGETITEHTVAVDGVTLDSTSADGTSVTAWISGGTVNTSGSATCHITTNQGRQQDDTIRFYNREL